MRRTLLVVAVLGFGPAARADEADDELARELAGMVRDPRLTVRPRVEAAKSLAKLGARAGAAVPDLVAQLRRLRGAELEPIQEAVIEALGQIGGPARTALPTLARTTGRTLDIDQAIKRATDQILASPEPKDVALLVEQLKSRDESVRLRAAKALGTQGPAAVGAVPALTAALADPDGDVRRLAAAALRKIQPAAKPTEDLLRALVQDLKDPDDAVRLSAVRALGRLGPAAAPAVNAIAELLGDPDRDVRRAATDALTRIAP